VDTYVRSVTWTKVSLKEAKIRATPKTSSPVGRGVKVSEHVSSQAVPLDREFATSIEIKIHIPSRTWGPKEMFSWAGF